MVHRSTSDIVHWLMWAASFAESLQFPRQLPEKRFNIEAVPEKNGTIMLHLKGRYGSTGTDGPMGDQGPSGIPGNPGPMGERGDPGFCSPQICDAVKQAELLLSRVEALEKMVKSRGIFLDQQEPVTSGQPIVALHITSDIVLTHGNTSAKAAASGLPRNINLNIDLNNDMKQSSPEPLSTDQHDGKFLINSTVFLEQGGAKDLKSGIAKAPKSDKQLDLTETQLQNPQNGYPQEVPSIKKSGIPTSPMMVRGTKIRKHRHRTRQDRFNLRS